MRFNLLFIFFAAQLLTCSCFCQDNKQEVIQLVDSLDDIVYVEMPAAKAKGKKYRIRVRSQQEFDSINGRLMAAIDKGEKNIIVDIAPGTYYFKENHIDLYQKKTNASISIRGHNAIVVAAGNNVGSEVAFEPYASYVDISSLKTYSCWGEMQFADSLIQVVDKEKKICRLPCKELKDTPKEKCKDVYVAITQWYKTLPYQVLEIKDGWLFLVADNLSYIENFNIKDYNVNYDFIYGKELPRFRMCRIPGDEEIREEKQNLHECGTSCFLSLKSSAFNTFTLTGFKFVGNKRGNPFLCLIWTKANKITIEDCTFEAINSRVAYISNTSNVVFEKDKVIGCYENGISADNDSENISVTNCLFDKCGWKMDYTFCLQFAGKNYYIANNTFRDFSYGAINTGAGRGNKNKGCSGIIENNEIYYTADYFKNKQKYTIMDSGAIQLATQHDGTIIRYNYIHDYEGMKDNRGIFCDEGARNLKIYGNVILNTPNCYSIDSRRVNRGEQDSLNNTGNVVMYNIVDNRIRFVGKDNRHNGCFKGNNIILYKAGTSQPKTQYESIECMKDDESLSIEGVSGNKIVVNSKTWRYLKGIPVFNRIKNHIKRI